MDIYKKNGYILKNFDIFNMENDCKTQTSHKIQKPEEFADGLNLKEYDREFPSIQSFYQKMFDDKYGKNWGKKFLDMVK